MRQTAKGKAVTPMYIQSATGRTNAHPFLAVAFDGQFLSFGLCSRLIRQLSESEREQIVETIAKIVKETR